MGIEGFGEAADTEKALPETGGCSGASIKNSAGSRGFQGDYNIGRRPRVEREMGSLLCCFLAFLGSFHVDTQAALLCAEEEAF
jgi:hypothetical protein